MTIEQLRLIHPRFVYKRFDSTVQNDTLVLSYEFLLEPDIVFRPRVMIPIPGFKDPQVRESLAPYVFNLGLAEAISYWKAACPREFVVEAGVLSGEQQRFWYDLFMHGLGEFYFQNKIDFTAPDFFRISSSVIPATEPASTQPVSPRLGGRGEPGSNEEKEWIPDQVRNDRQTGGLVLVGGGKDSAVTLGILKESPVAIQTMVLNPTPAALDSIRIAGYKSPIVVKREMDPKLVDLNKRGYLNGHTPFSAYLGFLGITVASLHNYSTVIVSNEKSASEGNVVYRGMEINHQYSKSFRFEQMFREYIRSYVIPDLIRDPSSASNTGFRLGGRNDTNINYFSFLRPLNDLQIAMIFATFPDFFTTFRSCNVGSKTNSWCGICPKCAFTYLILSPFLSAEQLRISFGADLFQNTAIIEHIRALVGLTPVKPFECVGTRDESILAIYLTIEKYTQEGREVPEGLLTIKSDLSLTPDRIVELRHNVLDNWGDVYNLPEEYLLLLKKAWEDAQSASK